jgi:hypothetical protein
MFNQSPAIFNYLTKHQKQFLALCDQRQAIRTGAALSDCRRIETQHTGRHSQRDESFWIIPKLFKVSVHQTLF